MPGKKFSGMSTVEDLRKFCRVDDFTGCWHWKGAGSIDKQGRKCQRVWVYDSVRREFRTMSGPIAVLEIAGKRTANTEMGWRTCRCEDCMNPQHVTGGTKKQWGNWLRNTGAWKNSPAHVLGIQRARAVNMKLSQEKVDAMRASGRKADDLAAEYDIAPNYARDILAFRRWNKPVAVIPGASVFTLASAR